MFHLIISLNSPIAEAAADFLGYESAMVENVVGNQRLLVRDVLLLGRTSAVWLYQVRMCYQISAIVHQKTPEQLAVTIKATDCPRHLFDGLSSRTTWVGRHQFGF